jgi:NAD(P)-dependent dehydrogenase (short-subunit alcohol dehydrogenase family)
MVEARYDFGFHRSAAGPAADSFPTTAKDGGDAMVLVTGATGALGGAVLSALGSRGVGASRGGGAGLLPMENPERLEAALAGRRLTAIVHCAWPAPDNTALTRLADVPGAVTHHVTEPLEQVVTLAQLLKRHGIEGATLILVGSTASEPGRHAYRKPLYSTAKAMIPTLARALAVELGAGGQRCTALVFDALDGGMSGGLSAAARVANADRSPFGLIPDMAEAARQVLWVLDNPSPLASGAVITVSGGALP